MLYGIGQTATLAELSIDTLRYYERIGLLRHIARNAGGQRQYSDADLQRLRFIRRAQAMNFSLEEIAQLLQLRDSPNDIRTQVRELTEDKLVAIENRISELVQLRDEITGLVQACRASKGKCPIIEHMSGEAS